MSLKIGHAKFIIDSGSDTSVNFKFHIAGIVAVDYTVSLIISSFMVFLQIWKWILKWQWTMKKHPDTQNGICIIKGTSALCV